jgi:hypothetical protein
MTCDGGTYWNRSDGLRITSKQHALIAGKSLVKDPRTAMAASLLRDALQELNKATSQLQKAGTSRAQRHRLALRALGRARGFPPVRRAVEPDRDRVHAPDGPRTPRRPHGSPMGRRPARPVQERHRPCPHRRDPRPPGRPPAEHPPRLHPRAESLPGDREAVRAPHHRGGRLHRRSARNTSKRHATGVPNRPGPRSAASLPTPLRSRSARTTSSPGSATPEQRSGPGRAPPSLARSPATRSPRLWTEREPASRYGSATGNSPPT